MLRIVMISVVVSALSTASRADAPNVVTDIAPVHGLVSMVTHGISEPTLVIEPSASPHTNAMRPSAAAALQDADVVFWIGPALAPWLEGPLATLASGATQIALMDVEGTQLLEFRESDAFGEHDHDHGHDHSHGHDHEDTAMDPHAWLDPANAAIWLAQIAATLSEIDPENAQSYTANAEAAQASILQEITKAEALLAPVKDQPFVVFHDAYHYFEARFGLDAIGALALSDAVPPSPSHVAEIQSDIRDKGVVCVFSEPQFSDRLVQTVIEGTEAKSSELDPLGVGLDLGRTFYPALIRDMAMRFQTCLQ